MSKFRKALAILLLLPLLSMLGLSPVWASPDPADGYTALGDSIAVGFSAPPGQGYTDQFADFLYNYTSTYSSGNFYPEGVSGATSGDLLSQLDTAQVQGEIAKSGIVTISIGGNNLLGPTIATVAQAFGLSPADPNLQQDLTAKIATDTAAQQKLTAAAQALPPLLTAGVNQFGVDWPQIIGKIKALSPGVQIYVNTLYNPFNASDRFFPLYDPAIQGINQVINAGKTALGYKVVDCYTALSGQQLLVNFTIPTSLDPHPTAQGHTVIAQTLIKDFVALSAASVGNNVVDLQWNTFDPAGYYDVFRATSASGPFHKVNLTPVSGGSFQDTQVSPGTSYWYIVIANVTESYNLQDLSLLVPLKVTTAAKTEVPTAIIGLKATAKSSSSIDLAWNPYETAASYNIYRATSAAGPFTKLNTQPVNTNSYNDTGLHAATTYWYKVTAVNAGGEGAFSNTASTTTLTAATTTAAELPKTGTNVDLLIPFGLLLAAFGLFLGRRQLGLANRHKK